MITTSTNGGRSEARRMGRSTGFFLKRMSKKPIREKGGSRSKLARQKQRRGESMSIRRPRSRGKQSLSLVLSLRRRAEKQAEDGSNNHMVSKVVDFGLRSRRKSEKQVKRAQLFKGLVPAPINQGYFKTYDRFNGRSGLSQGSIKKVNFPFINQKKFSNENSKNSRVYDRIRMTLDNKKDSNKRRGKEKVEFFLKRRKESKERYGGLLPCNKYKNYSELAKGNGNFDEEFSYSKNENFDYLEFTVTGEGFVGRLSEILRY